MIAVVKSWLDEISNDKTLFKDGRTNLIWLDENHPYYASLYNETSKEDDDYKLIVMTDYNAGGNLSYDSIRYVIIDKNNLDIKTYYIGFDD